MMPEQHPEKENQLSKWVPLVPSWSWDGAG